jgi:magnesium chelatase subunit D
MSGIYPWSAVVGQSQLKLALLLTAIDPSIGGVLVRGPRGVAKTTLARALSELVPGRFVELPLGATEDRVAGTLDLAAALQQGKVEFAPGLLASAHDGVLYVDEVNLLPDALIDLLLDAASSGVNVVERDGVSHRHAARFVLIGTMNPDEGELRPQLTDRFGLAVSSAAEFVPAERVEIVSRRLEFERDPDAFRARYADAQRGIAERCETARKRAPEIPLDREALAQIAERCFEAGVEGVRADLAMLRAARAHAAWHGRAQITEADIEAVAELALAHRRPEKRGPGPNGGAGGGSGAGSPPKADGPMSGTGAGGSASGQGASSQGASSQASASDGHTGTSRAVPVPALEAPELPAWLRAKRSQLALRASHARSRASLGRRRAAPVQVSKTINWFATLAHSRSRRVREIRYRIRPAAPALVILVLDCSASMLRGGALAAAKAVALALAADAPRARTELALIAFSGSRARRIRMSRTHLTAFERVLTELGAGGGTPIGAALREACTLARQADRRGSSENRLVLMTDGRTREAIDGLPLRRAALNVTLVDCERTRIRLGRAHAIATELGARYVHVDQLVRSRSRTSSVVPVQTKGADHG